MSRAPLPTMNNPAIEPPPLPELPEPITKRAVFVGDDGWQDSDLYTTEQMQAYARAALAAPSAEPLSDARSEAGHGDSAAPHKDSLERAEFEAWAKREGYGTDMEGDETIMPQVYCDPRTHAAWFAWNARAERAAVPASVVPATGDVVRHEPSGEEWLVAYVENDRLVACGWPESVVPVSDCTLLRRATPAQMVKLLHDMARSDGMRAAYARAALAVVPPGWIPVSERLPGTGVMVLVHLPNGHVWTAFWVSKITGNEWVTNCETEDEYDMQPTHWMPLPDGPAVPKEPTA